MLFIYVILIQNHNTMTLNFSSLKIALFALLIFSCSSNDDSNSNSQVFGTIQLSGSDTSSVGNTLVVGNIDTEAFNTTGTYSSVVLMDENTTIENGELVLTDFSNGFVMVAARFHDEDDAIVDQAISMTILSNGEEFRYGCTTPPTNATDNIDCGTGLIVDKIGKRVVFDDTTVINLDSGAILTMNGTINYN